MQGNTESDYLLFVDDKAIAVLRQSVKKNGLRHIRFHELRHSCASLLLAKKVPMKMTQEWLGRSDISTTSNIYSHLDAESKLESADIIGAALSS